MSQTEERVEGEKMEGLVQQQVVSLICTVYRGRDNVCCIEYKLSV